MAISFPSSPSNGQVFISGKTQYTYSTATRSWNAGPLQTAMPKNYLVNPILAVSQERGNTALACVAGNQYWAADQWCTLISSSVAGTTTVSNVLLATPRGSMNRYRFVATVAEAGVDPTDFVLLQQPIEGYRVADLQWGTAAAKQVIVRFSAVGKIGTYAFCIRNSPSNRSYVKTFTVTSTSVVQEYVFAVPGDTTGTWAKDNTAGMLFGIAILNGSGQRGGTDGAWFAGSAIGPSSPATTNNLTPAASQIEFFDFGIYADPNKTGLAPPFIAPVFPREERACQRHWSKAMTTIGIGIATVDTPQRSSFPHRVPMRANPASALVGQMRAWDQVAVPNITSIGTNYSNTMVAEYNYKASAGQTAGRASMIIDSSPTIYIAQNSRM